MTPGRWVLPLIRLKRGCDGQVMRLFISHIGLPALPPHTDSIWRLQGTRNIAEKVRFRLYYLRLYVKCGDS